MDCCSPQVFSDLGPNLDLQCIGHRILMVANTQSPYRPRIARLRLHGHTHPPIALQAHQTVPGIRPRRGIRPFHVLSIAN